MRHQTVPISAGWLAERLPTGWPVGSSAVITGPGGSGKPLVGNIVADSWLRAGGSLVFLSLQYPDRVFAYESFQRVTGRDLHAFEERIAFVDLDPERDATIGDPDGRGFSANVVYPPVWREAVERACAMVPSEGPGILILASALNLLLFSRTYETAICEAICTTMDDSRRTTLFSISSKPKEDLVHRIVRRADSVLYTDRPGDSFELYLEVRRFNGAEIPGERVTIPISERELHATRNTAEHSRKRVIPAISRI